MPSFVFSVPLPEPRPTRLAVRRGHRTNESKLVRRLIKQAELPPETLKHIDAYATTLVEAVRRNRTQFPGLDALLHEFDLSSREGVVLMCLAEALLRIPDAETADALIRDKIGSGDWEQHLGQSDSLLVNASTFALMLTGLVVRPEDDEQDWRDVFRRLVQRAGEPVIREAVRQAMRVLARQFVLGRTIEEAVARAAPDRARGILHSFDMLGEAARTARDADRYLASYTHAISVLGRGERARSVFEAPGISVKLSALHPRFEFSQRRRVMDELLPRVRTLAEHAKAAGIGLFIDAEESERLELSLDIIDALSAASQLAGWNGLGFVVQAYQKRAFDALDEVAEIARRDGRRLMLRLVKGAYWDSEIKRAQVDGQPDYPVFTRKVSTDVSYIACAKKLAAASDALFPCFATHNARTLAAVEAIAGGADFEFQRLHGMGEALYDEVLRINRSRRVRVYAPVGGHADLLAYLVRRLLENGANTSFVNRIVDERLPVAEVVADPVQAVRVLDQVANPRIPLPADIYAPERRNSAGLDLNDPLVVEPFARLLEEASQQEFSARAIVGGSEADGNAKPVISPADHSDVVGHVFDADEAAIDGALARASAAQFKWDARGGVARAAILERASDVFEAERAQLVSLIVREGGRTLPDAVSEVREAVDYLRYYGAQAGKNFSTPQLLPGPTGEDNSLALRGRGVFFCISPWNFPFAIFTGQIAAALASGNCVLAKPAERTPLIAATAVRILHRAGVPGDVLHLLPGSGSRIGNQVLGDPRIAGVVVTGSTETARTINRLLAAREGTIVPLIAETGGQNAMIVDSSALPEQVVRDALTSAFNSAGQRCSALRVLFLQSEIAERTIEMLVGAMAELKVGNPRWLATDVGPVIDEDARKALGAHVERMQHEARHLATVPLPDDTRNGTFFAPHAFEIPSISVLTREVFGPILHVVRYAADKLDAVADGINGTGYGLTVSIHSRVDTNIQRLLERLRVGNAYVNRNQIGAVVGVQPFGGEGLSGTGPKAGGPHYLHRFAVERAASIDTTAAGGNAALLAGD
jgi:RHH-type transcriptional regulator, proline utilization regulon repressor / proline dehydrogenase / delta 1-pyrroline-5-carboxylate dehydrogenase